MKKILAMFVAFACTLGAFADVIQANISGTDFSTYPVGVFTPGLNDSGTDDGTSYWYTGFADDLDAEVVNLSTDEESGVAVNYLAFESNVTNPLYRTVNNCYGFVEGETQDVPKKAVDRALFIDTTVQFTPYLVNENHPAPTKTSDQDKIIVWVRETEISEGVCETNLIVTAGYILGGALVEPKDYVIDMTPAAVSALCQGQHRLTIKAFDNITSVPGVTIMGFVVYIDRTAVSYSSGVSAFSTEAVDQNYANLKTTPAVYYTVDSHKLFPSMVTPDQWNVPGYSSITAVGFAGMGQIGEVWFDDYTTDYPAFAGDNLNFTVVVGNGVTSFDYLGETYTETTRFDVAPGTTNIVITGVQYDTENGWSAKTNTWFVGETVVGNLGETNGDRGTFFFDDGDVFELAGYKPNFEVVVGETVSYFETLTGKITEIGGALDAVNGGKLTLLNDVEVTGFEIEFGQTITIDLNGKTIVGSGNIAATIDNAGTLKIIDSSEGKTGRVLGFTSNDLETGEPLYTPVAIVNWNALTINAGEYALVVAPEEAEDATFAINGGKFMMIVGEDAPPKSAEEFHLYGSIAEGLSAEMTEEEGVYYVTIGEAVVPATPVAKIGETEYTSLADAIAAATAESTIQIIANIGTDSAFVIEKTVKIDLNGYTIATTENDKDGNGVFWVKTGGKLTINDTSVNRAGVINGVGGNGWNIGIFADNGKVIIKGGNFTNEGATDGDKNDHFDLIYVKNGGIVEITGGTFRCETPRWTLNKKNTTGGSFVVTGGKFYQYDPTNINTDDQPVTSWCSAGYKATLGNDGYYTVEEIPEVTVTLPVAPANTTLKAFVGEDEVAITDNVITVLAGSSVVLELTAAEGYEFSKDVTVYTTEAAVVNENADWSSIVLPAVTQIVTDPWAPAADTDAAAQTKVAEIFEGYPAAIASITTYAQYTNLVAYVKAVKEKGDVVDFAPTGLLHEEKLYIVDSFKLGANPLFTDEPQIKLTEPQPSTKKNAEAGDWEFNVKVTQGSADDAFEVAVEKVKAFVKICSDLKNGQWAAPQAENIDADPVTGSNVITITIKFGDAKSGFMMIAE